MITEDKKPVYFPDVYFSENKQNPIAECRTTVKLFSDGRFYDVVISELDSISPRELEKPDIERRLGLQISMRRRLDLHVARVYLYYKPVAGVDKLSDDQSFSNTVYVTELIEREVATKQIVKK